ncbi:MAG: hypothetical protein ABF904_13530 [Ethanoligenens sp.]
MGIDENDIPRHAHKRGTYTKGQPYQSNVEGSDSNCSFHYIGTDGTLLLPELRAQLLSACRSTPESLNFDAFIREQLVRLKSLLNAEWPEVANVEIIQGGLPKTATCALLAAQQELRRMERPQSVEQLAEDLVRATILTWTEDGCAAEPRISG